MANHNYPADPADSSENATDDALPAPLTTSERLAARDKIGAEIFAVHTASDGSLKPPVAIALGALHAKANELSIDAADYDSWLHDLAPPYRSDTSRKLLQLHHLSVEAEDSVRRKALAAPTWGAALTILAGKTTRSIAAMPELSAAKPVKLRTMALKVMPWLDDLMKRLAIRDPKMANTLDIQLRQRYGTATPHLPPADTPANLPEITTVPPELLQPLATATPVFTANLLRALQATNPTGAAALRELLLATVSDAESEANNNFQEVPLASETLGYPEDVAA